MDECFGGFGLTTSTNGEKNDPQPSNRRRGTGAGGEKKINEGKGREPGEKEGMSGE